MAIFSALGSVIGGMQAKAGTDQAQGFTQEMWSQVSDKFSPWMEAGKAAAVSLPMLLGGGGATADLQPFQQMGMDRITQTANPFDPNAIGEGFQKSPGYQFMLDEGQAAIDASASAKGGMLSGATVKAGQDRNIGLANQDYWNYVNQNQQGMQLDAEQRQQQFANIFGVSGQGLQATSTFGQLGMQGAGQLANAAAAGGAAQGAGTQGAFGAIGKFLNPFG